MSEMGTSSYYMCVLSANDGVNISVPIDVAKISITIKNMMEDIGDTEEDNNIVPIPVVNGAILQKIYIFCNYIHNNPSELDNLNLWLDDTTYTFQLSQWFIDYLNVDQETMLEVTKGANFLDISVLLNMQCKYIACIIRNKTPDELRILFQSQTEAEASNTQTQPEASN